MKKTSHKFIAAALSLALAFSGIDVAAGSPRLAYAEEGMQAKTSLPLTAKVAADEIGNPSESEGGAGGETGDPSQEEPAPPVAPAVPAIVTVVNGKGAIEVAWQPVEHAVSYLLERCVSGGKYIQIAALDAETTAYADRSVAFGTKYAYRLRAVGADGKATKASPAKSIKRLAAPAGLSAAATGKNVLVRWAPVAGASGYKVYRQPEGTTEPPVLLATVSGAQAEGWADTAPLSNAAARYTVTSVSGSSESAPSAAAGTWFVSDPAVKSLKRKSNTSYLVKWTKNAKATGYQVQYSRSALFTSRKTVTLRSNATVQQTLKGLASKKTYYVRVRAFLKKGGRTYYSAWSHSSNVLATKNLSLSARTKMVKQTVKKVVKKKTVKKVVKKPQVFELRAQAKQAMYGYDTVQGSCTDGTYGYFCLYNRKVEKCKIAKVRLSDLKVVKVSGVLPVAHGNDIAYDAKRKRLAVVHTSSNAKRISLVSPGSLKVTKRVDVAVSKGLAGATDAQRKAVSGFCGIAYSKARDQYILLLNKSYDFLVLDGDLRPVRYAAAGGKNRFVYQGIDATDDYVLVGQSRHDSGRPNYLLVYDWEGTYLATVRLQRGDELESLFHIGSKFYASFYRSYYKTTYTKEKKVVRVHGKRQVKKVTVRHRTFQRDNYLFAINGL